MAALHHWIRTGFYGVSLLLVVLIVMLLIRTTTVQTRQIAVQPASPPAIDTQQAVRHLQQAIRFQTVSGGEEHPAFGDTFTEFHRFLEQAFPLMHRHLEKQTVNEHSLVYLWTGTNPEAQPLLFLAHMDVVPVDPDTRAKWQHEPFSGFSDDEHVWGRGAMDNKSSLIALCESVEYLLQQGFRPQRTIYLVFGHDEEIGGYHGAAATAAMFERQGLRFKFVLDEGMFITTDSFPEVQAPVALVAVAEKGYVTLTLTATDAGGHSSRPTPHTAIGRLATAIHRLEAKPMKPQLTRPVAWMLDYLGPEMPFEKRLILMNRWLFGSLVTNRFVASPDTNALVRTTAAATVVKGGVKENVLPTQATAMVNFRILPDQSVDQIVRYVQQVIRDSSIDVQVLGDTVYEPTPIAEIQGSEAFLLLQKTVSEVYQPVVIAPTLLVAGTDARHFSALSDQVFRFQPIKLAKADFTRFHGIDERIAISSFAQMIAFYVKLIENSETSLSN